MQHSYEWIFSGIGVFLLTGVIWLIRHLFRREPAPQTKANIISGRDTTAPMTVDSRAIATITAPIEGSQVAVGANIQQSIEDHHHYGDTELAVPQDSEPIPSQIFDDIHRAAPFDKDHVTRKYAGVPVDWRVRLGSVSEFSGGNWTIISYFQPVLSAPLGSGECVTFALRSVPPALRAAPYGSILRVSGVIEKIEFGLIYLKREPEIIKIERPD